MYLINTDKEETKLLYVLQVFKSKIIIKLYKIYTGKKSHQCIKCDKGFCTIKLSCKSNEEINSGNS